MSDVAIVPVLGLPDVVTPVGLNLPPDLPFEAWQRAGETLGRLGRSLMWYVGDWLAYGEAAYGERYSQAIQDTGYDYQTLANAAWVARRIEPSRRREVLSWSHHAAVAALPPAEADELLGRAAPTPGEEKPALTTRELRAIVREREVPTAAPVPWQPHCATCACQPGGVEP